MDSAVKYNFADFTEKNYGALLKFAKREYKFISYGDIGTAHGKFIVLRHDIDFSPHRALSLATIESKLGVRTTYCIQLTSMFYNVLEKDIRAIFLKIKKMGHVLGLHFDSSVYNIKTIKQMRQYIQREKKILSQLLGCELNIISFHNPTHKELSINRLKIAGLINTCAPRFMQKMKYLSDSNGYWRHERLEDILRYNQHKQLHVLLHPEWWQKEILSPWNRIKRCIHGRSKFVLSEYRSQLHKAGRKIINGK